MGDEFTELGFRFAFFLDLHHLRNDLLYFLPGVFENFEGRRILGRSGGVHGLPDLDGFADFHRSENVELPTKESGSTLGI